MRVCGVVAGPHHQPFQRRQKSRLIGATQEDLMQEVLFRRVRVSWTPLKPMNIQKEKIVIHALTEKYKEKNNHPMR